MAPRRAASRGFTFLGLMFLIIVMALMATAAATTWTFTGQRDKEEQLIFVGREYRSALSRYALAHARQPQPYPTSLEQLLGGDDRQVPVRYLRRLYFDPITGDSNWGLVRTPQGGITGVFSLSDRRPIRTRGPKDTGIAFDKAKSYRDWIFASGAAASPVPDAAVPGWNYERDGAPPPTWENPPATPAPELVPPG